MAGKDSYGSVYNNAGAGNFRQCKAFSEGVQYRASDTALNVPKTDDPHETGSEASLAWTAGWNLADANTGTVISRADLGSVASVGVVPA